MRIFQQMNFIFVFIFIVQSFVFSADRVKKDAFVYLDEGLEQKAFLLQKGCRIVVRRHITDDIASVQYSDGIFFGTGYMNSNSIISEKYYYDRYGISRYDDIQEEPENKLQIGNHRLEVFIDMETSTEIGHFYSATNIELRHEQNGILVIRYKTNNIEVRGFIKKDNINIVEKENQENQVAPNVSNNNTENTEKKFTEQQKDTINALLQYIEGHKDNVIRSAKSNGFSYKSVRCPMCDGTGRVTKDSKCKTCKGRGNIRKKYKNNNFKIYEQQADALQEIEKRVKDMTPDKYYDGFKKDIYRAVQGIY